MELRSNFNLTPSTDKIKYSDSLFFIGSCFSDNISNTLEKRKFNTRSNPFGILYNPISVFENLENILSKKIYTEKNLFLKDEIWNCFEFHSDMSGTNKTAVLENISLSIKNNYKFLAKTKMLFITFGTAWVYEKDHKVVANCYKINSQKFTKRLLSIDEIYTKGKSLIQQIKSLNKDITIVFTVSPVRHLKDGFTENNQSKSSLILAIKKICDNLENTSYFPAYELLMDDLRDYRFFEEDFIHPNKLAISYILAKFDEHYFGPKTLDTIKNIEKINSSLNHSVRFNETKSHIDFKEILLKKILEMEKFGFDFSQEKESIH